jgi:hypothetical protein
MVMLGATCGNYGSYTLNNSFTEGNDQGFGSTSTGATGVTGRKLATGAAETPSATYSSSPNRQAIVGFAIKVAPPPPLYPDCESVIAGGYRLTSDLDGDCYVGYQDLGMIAYYWLRNDCVSLDNCQGADFAPTDGMVDFLDFSDFAPQWMQCNDPTGANCAPNW